MFFDIRPKKMCFSTFDVMTFDELTFEETIFVEKKCFSTKNIFHLLANILARIISEIKEKKIFL
jgi:hypothetical protein